MDILLLYYIQCFKKQYGLLQYFRLLLNMIKIVPNLMRKFVFPSLIKNIPKYFCAEFQIDPFIQHYAQITMRQHRRLFLNRSVLNQSKDVAFAELRKPNEGMIDLKQKGKCPGVIERISGKVQEEIDIVLDGKKMRKLSKTQIFPLTPLYVRVQGKQYRCIYYKLDFHPDGFIQKVYLKEYVPGEPNYLKIPIELTHVTSNPYVMKNEEFDQKIDDIEIICYNEEYPMRLYVDISYCSPDRPYRIGDLANTLPPGIILNPKYNLNDKIVIIIQEAKKDKIFREEIIKEMVEQSKKSKEAKPGQAGGTPGATDAGKDKAAGGAGQAAGGTTAAKTGGAATGGGKK